MTPVEAFGHYIIQSHIHIYAEEMVISVHKPAEKTSVLSTFSYIYKVGRKKTLCEGSRWVLCDDPETYLYHNFR